jgi:methionyl-tRNA formyltransferase
VELALLVRSVPGGLGGTLRQGIRPLARSGPLLLPYLLANYALPGWAAAARRLAGTARPDGLAAVAAACGVPLLDVAAVNGAATQEALARARADLLVSFHFDQIFAPETLAAAPRGGINLHPSLLPRHRGPVPTIWALAEDPPAFGVTVHRLAPRIDAGAVLAQRAVKLPEGVTASAAARALHEAGVPLLEEVLATLAAGEDPAAGRDDPPLPYCPFPPPAVLRALARRGRRTVDACDWRAAWKAPVG